MEWLTPLLPVTVIAAIALFVAKEVVEGFRRWRADARKGRAFRTLLARECELNHWTYKQLKDTLLVIQEDFENGVAAEYAIKRRETGDAFLRQEYDGRGWSEAGLPDVRTDLMSKIMLDVAILDRSLFARLEAAYDSAMNMKHLRESLIRFIDTDDEQHKTFLKRSLSTG